MDGVAGIHGSWVTVEAEVFTRGTVALWADVPASKCALTIIEFLAS